MKMVKKKWPPPAERRWFQMDVAGRIYPAARTREWNCTYRLAFLLREDVDPALLCQAVEDIYPRFPAFFVNLRSGLFWNYLERMPFTKEIVQPETQYPCRMQPVFHATLPLLRVLYYKNRLAVETSHAVSDGAGSSILIKTLTARYLELKGSIAPNACPELPSLQEAPREVEVEDPYMDAYTREKLPPVKEQTSWEYRVPRLSNYLQVIHGRAPVEDLKKAAKQYELTVTEYLSAAFLYALYEQAAGSGKRPFKLSIPIALRRIYPTESLRNFTLYTNIGFDPKAKDRFSFEDIVEVLRGQIKKGLSPQVLQRILNQNASLVMSKVVSAVPYALKKPFMRIGFSFTGQNKFSCTLSNLGTIEMPQALRGQVICTEALMSEMPTKRLLLGTISDEEYINLYFTGDHRNVEVQKIFFRLLTSHGSRLRVDSNEPWKGEESA